MSTTTQALASGRLFADLDTDEVSEVAAVATPWSATSGTVLFRQGDPGDRVLMLTSGRLEVMSRSPTGEQRVIGVVEAGSAVGELALLFGGRRTATVVAAEDSAGVALERQAFAYLRMQRRPAALSLVERIGTTALQRLARRYDMLASELPATGGVSAAGVRTGSLRRTEVPVLHLAPLLFFRNFAHHEIARLLGEQEVVSADRHTDLGHGDSVWIVLAGAVETMLDNGRAHRRLRLAGPGRVVGHLAISAGGDHVLPLHARLRERAILLRVPAPDADALMASDEPHARRFAEAFHEDTVRALIAAETMQLPVVTARREPGASARRAWADSAA